MAYGAKYGSHQFLYGLGLAETVKKFPALPFYPAQGALSRAVQIGQSQIKFAACRHSAETR